MATDLAVPDGRTLYISKERGVDARWASPISGYWRRGRTEERELASQKAEAEQGANA